MSKKISDLTAGATPDGTELVEAVQGGDSVSLTTQQIANLASAASRIIPQWDFVDDFGGDPTYATDSTVAFQNALDTIAAAGGGELFMGYSGHFKIGGAFQDTSRGNAQILIPAPVLNTQQIPITIRGGVPPSTVFSVGGSTPTPTEGVILESTLTSGNGAVIGGWGPSGAFADFVFTKLVFENLTVRTQPDPTYSGINFSHISDLVMNNVVVDSGTYTIASLTAPTTPASFALRLPGNNNDAFTLINGVDVCGFYNGVEIGEHACGVKVGAWGCINAFVFPFAYHASSFQRLMAVWCTNVLVSTGVHYTRIGQLDLEHAASGWQVTAHDVLDASNQLYGDLKWHAVLAGFGVHSTFTKSGGVNLQTIQLGDNTVAPPTLGSAITALSISSGVVNIDCSLGDYFTLALTANVTSLTFSNAPATGTGRTLSVTITQDVTGSRTFALPASFKAISGSDTAVQSAANAVTKMSIETVNSGTTWAYVMKARA